MVGREVVRRVEENNFYRRKAVENIGGFMERKQSELTVITKAKDLCSYVMTVTQKSPKQFRFTFVSRLENLCYGLCST